jgi:hypothetical protein
MELIQPRGALWKSMWEVLAEPWARKQEKLGCPAFEKHPQFLEQRKSSLPNLWITGIE